MEPSVCNKIPQKLHRKVHKSGVVGVIYYSVGSGSRRYASFGIGEAGMASEFVVCL